MYLGLCLTSPVKIFFFLRAVVSSRKNSFSCLGEVYVGKLRFLSPKKMLCFGLYWWPGTSVVSRKDVGGGESTKPAKIRKVMKQWQCSLRSNPNKDESNSRGWGLCGGCSDFLEKPFVPLQQVLIFSLPFFLRSAVSSAGSPGVHGKWFVHQWLDGCLSLLL